MPPAVASLTPANGAVDVQCGVWVECNLTNATDMDPDLVEVTVGGHVCTIANGLLDYWGGKDISGGVLVDDFTDLWFTASGWWVTRAGELVAVVVEYDSVEISSTTFTVISEEDHDLEADGVFEMLAVAADDPIGGDGKWNVGELSPCGDHIFSYLVEDLGFGIVGDGWYYIGHRFSSAFPASGIAAAWHAQQHLASGIVNGTFLSPTAASGVVQGWALWQQMCSGAVGIRFIFGTMCSGIVAVKYLGLCPASGVVYGVLHHTVLDVRIKDETTYLALSEAGVTFGDTEYYRSSTPGSGDVGP